MSSGWYNMNTNGLSDYFSGSCSLDILGTCLYVDFTGEKWDVYPKSVYTNFVNGYVYMQFNQDEFSPVTVSIKCDGVNTEKDKAI